MRTQEREIGGKRTESRDRIGRSRRQRRGKGVCLRDRHQVSSSAPSDHPAAYLGSFAQREHEEERRRKTISAVRLRTKRNKIQLWDTLNQRGIRGFFEGFIEIAAMEGSLSSAGEQKKRREGSVRGRWRGKTNPSLGE